MKKTIQKILLGIVTISCLTGCGVNLGDYQNNKVTPGDPMDLTTTTTQAKTKMKGANLNEPITLEFTEINLTSAATSEEMKPEKTKSVYQYRKKQDGKTYFYVKGTIKNTSGEQFEFADNMYVKFTFDNKYSYDGAVVADEDGSFSYIYAYLEPLETHTFYLYASIPNELIESYQNVDVYFGFKNNFEHEYGITEDECDHVFNLKLSK